MSFNELNTVENFIIYKLSGANLNTEILKPGLLKAKSPTAKNQLLTAKSQQWKYKTSTELDREVQEVLIESELKSALIRINPEINKNPDLADEVLYKLRAILISVNQIGLVKANEEFTEWLKGEKTLPFGANNRHVPVRLIDFEKLENNSFVVTNQFRVHARETKIPDVVLLINGIPVVVGEAKTPIRPAISWLDGANEIQEVYENTIPQLFVPNILSFAT